MVVNVINQIDANKNILTPPQISKGAGIEKLSRGGQVVSLGGNAAGQDPISPGLNKEQMQEELQKAIEETNSALEFRHIALAYSVDQTTEDIVVKVIDKSTDKLIRQIPPESVLKFRGKMKELLGVIFDENG